MLIQIQSNKDLMRREIYFDELFIPKFLYIGDNKMHQWLKQCCSAKSILDTNIELLNFSQTFSDIQHNRFSCNLPSSISKLSPSEENTRKKRKEETEKLQTQELTQNESFGQMKVGMQYLDSNRKKVQCFQQVANHV